MCIGLGDEPSRDVSNTHFTVSRVALFRVGTKDLWSHPSRPSTGGLKFGLAAPRAVAIAQMAGPEMEIIRGGELYNDLQLSRRIVAAILNPFLRNHQSPVVV